MKYRIAMWASAGLIVAGCWGVYFATGKQGQSDRTHRERSRPFNLPGCDSWPVFSH